MQSPTVLRTHIVSLAVLAWLSICSVAMPQGVAVALPSSPVRDQLRARIEAANVSSTVSIHRESLHTWELLARFYVQRAFQPVWIGDDSLLPHTEVFMQTIRQSGREGLKPVAYHLPTIETLITELRQPWERESSQTQGHWVDLELLLTDAYFMYGAHVVAGQIDPKRLGEVWFADRTELDLVTPLQQAIETDSVGAFLSQLRPIHRGYAGLQKAWAYYQDIAARGGWPIIADGPALQRGDHGARVEALRNRLLSTGDLEQGSVQNDEVFDAAIEGALQKFQQRHGLAVDGVVGASTLAALNVPVGTRIRQIELNMERWRWLPQDLGDRYILVNIANFTLDVVEKGQSVLTMRVVAGKPTRRTPFFSARMTYLVLSPHWYVPPTIAVQDKLPLIRRDPRYAARQNLKIFRDGPGGATRVDPMAIDWSSVSARNFPYRLRQDPGPRNALGRVKFMFPNPHHVYLHDTPSRELFAREERAFSSGCIRLEKPIELAEYLLRDDPRWSRQSILAGIQKGSEQVVHLPAPMPVYLFYWTTWMSDEGVVHFRKDIYERDSVLDGALQKAVPSAPGEGTVEMVMKHP
jgi:murein L,D-transpeptidase YcbB/YkuD